MEAELASARDSIADLELRVEDSKATLIERVEYVAHLENSLVPSTSTTLRQEGQLQSLHIRLDTMEDQATMTKEKATIIMVMMEVAKQEAA